jgi:DNA-binding helix-turn-helix protein|nr:MAG TPA: hypothetical protein [Caudoviricetes sp.]
MNNLMIIDAVSMNSLEISEMLGSRHDSVKRSVERLAESGVIQLPPMAEVKQEQTLSPNNRSKVYVFTGEQGKRDSIIVVAQLSPEFTAKIVDRWLELERANSRMPTELEMLAMLANKAVEQERKIAQHEAALEVHDKQLESVNEELKKKDASIAELKEELKLYRDEEQFFVAKAAAKMYGCNNISNPVAQKLGMALSKLSREMGYDIQKRKHCDFTEVGAYHIDVIRELFEIRGYELY